ncbi:hypothetical protein [Aromatoleum toluclasticum]|uniref:hypothetical protein n=1 Tax=Aromatoleum toluclasticum TaxID=92003 RepID=UPI0012F7DAC5|nr:hypothetical protein [Aromatoleum toluclasticum]
MKSKEPFAFPLPGFSHQESRVLRQLVVWADEYLRKKAATKSRYIVPPTTEQCTKHFHVSHNEMMTLLNRLERDGLVSKERRLSAGLSGNGFDGSLHSSVLPTMKARDLVARSPK